MRFFLTGVALCGLVGCVTQPLQTRRVVRESHDLPQQIQLNAVPFLRQDKGYCGPAALTMAMQAAGQPVTLEQVTPEVYTPKNEGTLQLDIIGATRRHGLLAVPILELRELLVEVAAGHPVLVFENLGLSWFPQWHYAVVTGYDLAREEVIVHSGDHPFDHVDMSRFEYAWRGTQNWAVVILPPGQLAASVDDLRHVTAAAGLEQAGRVAEAEVSYQAILDHWPRSLGALIGMGNVSYGRQDYQASVKYLTLATEVAPESKTARHNLEVAREALKE